MLADALDDNAETFILADGAQWQDGATMQILIAQLPAEQAYLIDLAFFHGMSHTDIAESLKMPLGTVKTRLRTGLRRLREL